MTLRLEHVLFFGRTWDECLNMYAIDEARHAHDRVLDCPGGPDGLVAGGLDRGFNITAVDPLYSQDADALEQQATYDINHMLERWQADPEMEWSEDRAAPYRAKKLEALGAFMVAFRSQPDRFIAGELPALAFADDAFDLVLSGHFLFTYASVEQGGCSRRRRSISTFTSPRRVSCSASAAKFGSTRPIQSRASRDASRTLNR